MGETELGMKGGKEGFISRVDMYQAFMDILHMTSQL